MSDETERRLREAGHRLPGPDPDDTLAARARFLEAAAAPRRRLPRRGALLAFAATLAVAGAFGVGYAVAGSGTKTVTKTRTRVVQVKERLNAGPGFLPADGWATSVVLDPQSGAVASATAKSAAARIDAGFLPASVFPNAAQGLLPLQLPAGGARRELLVHVGAYAVHVTIAFASAHPTPGQLVAAREELGRLVVPSCPAALPVRPGDIVAAIRAVFRWLPAHYSGPPSDLVRASARAHRGRDMPRYGEAAADCGAVVASQSFEVEVTLPTLAKVSASLSQLTFFVAKTSDGWTVWERAR